MTAIEKAAEDIVKHIEALLNYDVPEEDMDEISYTVKDDTIHITVKSSKGLRLENTLITEYFTAKIKNTYDKNRHMYILHAEIKPRPRFEYGLPHCASTLGTIIAYLTLF